MKRLSLAALFLSACASPRVTQIPCHAWDLRSNEVRNITLQALAPPEFICGERICYGHTKGQQAGICYFGCPDDWLPDFCEAYR